MHTAVLLPYRSRGESGLLAWVLEGYAQQQLAQGHTLEVHVGFDGPESQIEVPFASGTGITCIAHPYPRIGAAAVRNRLAHEAASQADLFIFGNADARPMSDMVQRHADTMAQLPPQSLILGSAPWERPPVPTVFHALLAESPMVFFYCTMKPRNWHDFRYAWTLNLSVRRQDFFECGGFHDELRPVFYEDLAFGFRLMGTRKAVWYEPAASVVHRHPMNLDQYLDREEMLGLMAPVLLRVFPEAFERLFGTKPPLSDSRRLLDYLDKDRRHYAKIYRAMGHWASVPVDTLGQHRTSLLHTLHLLHVPLKRTVFQLGFVRGLEMADDSRWLERKPMGLWRQFLL
jgi:hypothetical protein